MAKKNERYRYPAWVSKKDGTSRHTKHLHDKKFLILLNFDLSPSEMILFLRIMEAEIEYGQCKIGANNLAKLCHCSPPTIATAKRSLFEKGLISIEEEVSSDPSKKNLYPNHVMNTFLVVDELFDKINQNTFS